MDRSPQTSGRLEQLFQQALDLEPGARASFLEHRTRGDSKLLEAVEQLLDAYAHAENSRAWEKNALDNIASTSAAIAGSTLDRYRLLQQIGAGGMALVYKAVRADDEFSKLVAVKILLAPDPDSAERFRHERQILAGLEHPNIARLLDGGTSAGGAPFLVMEYVEGKPLDRYVHENRLSLREILTLFRKICAAISYAHRNLVVHRDLKPANILVTAEGEPKVLDFGIARLLDGSAARTRTGFGAMTLEYASPEQVQGSIIGTATDVYSLGVVLYELLCGTRPYRNALSAIELARAIAEADVQTPCRQDGAALDADLRNILQMALRREPERRYRGPDQLADDIRRYQEGYPVLSRPDTYRYRLRKFVGRNRLALAAAFLMLAAIAGGVIAAARQASIANRRFNEARRFANSYLFEVHDAIKDLPGATEARRLVVKRALEYLDSVAAERGNDRALRRELAAAYARIADIQGRPVRNSFGDRPGALASLRKAIAILAPMAADSPDDAGLAEQLALIYEDANAVAVVQGDLTVAADYSRKGIALMTRLASAHPGDAKLRNALASVYVGLGDVSGNPFTQNLGDTKTAIECYAKAGEIWQKLSAEAPGDLDRLMLVAIATGRKAQMLEAIADRAAAVDAYRKVVEMDEHILVSRPADSRMLSDVAVANRNLARALLAVNDIAAAGKFATRSMQVYQQIASADANNFEARTALGYGFSILARLQAQAGQPGAALRNFERAIAIYAKSKAERPGTMPPLDLRSTYEAMADLWLQAGAAARAEDCARNELDFDNRLLAINPSNASALRNQGVANRQIGLAHEFLAMRARPARRKLEELREALGFLHRASQIAATLQAHGQLPPMYAADINLAGEAAARVEREVHDSLEERPPCSPSQSRSSAAAP